MNIGIVGPCSAGKTTLIAGLKDRGITARHVAQEHSFVPDMWDQQANVEILLYLDVSYEVSMRRRQLDMTLTDFEEQKRRLNHALRHADLYVNTDELTVTQVLGKVIEYLEDRFQ